MQETKDVCWTFASGQRLARQDDLFKNLHLRGEGRRTLTIPYLCLASILTNKNRGRYRVYHNVTDYIVVVEIPRYYITSISFYSLYLFTKDAQAYIVSIRKNIFFSPRVYYIMPPGHCDFLRFHLCSS